MRMIVTQRTFFSIGAGEFPWGAQSCLDLCLALNFEDCNVTICSTLNINFWRIMNTCSRFINTYTYTYLYFHLHYVWIFFRKWVRHVVFNLIHLPYIQMIYIYMISITCFSLQRSDVSWERRDPGVSPLERPWPQPLQRGEDHLLLLITIICKNNQIIVWIISIIVIDNGNHNL